MASEIPVLVSTCWFGAHNPDEKTMIALAGLGYVITHKIHPMKVIANSSIDSGKLIEECRKHKCTALIDAWFGADGYGEEFEDAAADLYASLEHSKIKVID